MSLATQFISANGVKNLKQEHIGPVIKVVSNFIEQELTADSERLGLTSGQMHILHFVCRNRETGVCRRRIEEFFELSHATVAGIVDRLEAKGFVTCVESESDKRYKSVFPTERALECDAEMHRCIVNAEARFFEGFTETEKEEFRRYLGRILVNLGVKLPGREVK